MARPSIGPRLYIRRRKGREPRYVILDGTKEIGTSFSLIEKEQATAALASYLESQHKADFGNGDPRRVLVSDILTLYGEKKAPTNRRPDVDGSAIGHLATFFATDHVANLTPDRCAAYVTWRTAMPSGRFKDPAKAPRVGPVTARRELQVLSACIGFAHREHKLTHTVVIAMPENGQPRDRYLSRDEAAKLVWAAYRGLRPPLEKADDRKKKEPPLVPAKHLVRFILVALYTGTRHEAVTGLRWVRSIDTGSVDLKAGLIYRRGLREAESSKRRPPVPISPRLAAHLRRWARVDEAAGLAHVITFEGKPMLSVRRSWGTARRAAGLGADVVPHVLRHTFATWAIQNGHSLEKVAATLGTSTQMIEATYGHHAPDHLRDVVDFTRRQTVTRR